MGWLLVRYGQTKIENRVNEEGGGIKIVKIVLSQL